jgi:hypothetical protein
MIKDSDSDELNEVYRLHQETCENLRRLKKKYGVSKRAHDIETLRRIVESKTGKRLKKTMSVRRDHGPDETVQSDFAFFLGLTIKNAFLTGKISTLNGKKLWKKNGKYLYIRDYKKLLFLETPREAGTCCICGRKTRLWSHHVVPRRLTKEKGRLGNRLGAWMTEEGSFLLIGTARSFLWLSWRVFF